jgi:hypothetical protein
MPLFQALGLGVLILVLQSSLPRVLTQAEATSLAFLRGAEVSAVAATNMAAAATSLSHMERPGLPRALPDFPLPQASQVISF